MRYHYLRLELHNPWDQTLFRNHQTDETTLSRQAYLQEVLGQTIYFEHFNKNLVYLPIGDLRIEKNFVLLGRIGKKIETVENAPPEEKFAEIIRPSWRAANILIDIADHADGQKIAFQEHYQVGNPKAVSRSLALHLNRAMPFTPWFIKVNRITDERSFWETVESHEGDITHVQFALDAPNLLGMGEAQLRDELEDKRKKYNATSVTESIHNPKGGLLINPDTVGEVVKYVSEGGGRSSVKG